MANCANCDRCNESAITTFMWAGGRFMYGWIVKLLDGDRDCEVCGHRLGRYHRPATPGAPSQPH
jgi:hypothetical protein